MTDPLFIILRTLNIILERITGIFFFIFTNYFPDEPPQDKPEIGFVGMDI